MSGDQPDPSGRESARERFVDALEVHRNARVGLAVGLVVAAGAHVTFVVLPGAPLEQALAYLVLAFVVLVTTTVLVTLALTVRTAARLTMSPPRWIRRAGTASLGGGVAWALLAAATPLAVSTSLRAVYGWLPVVVLGPLAGAWAVHTAHRGRDGYLGLAGAVLAGLGILVVGWLAASDPAALFGRPVRVSARSLHVAHLLALVGTWLVGAGALRARQLPRAVSLAALFALPGALAGLTALAYADLGAYAAVPPGLALGGAWAGIGAALREGWGVPPAEAFYSAAPGPGGLRGPGGE